MGLTPGKKLTDIAHRSRLHRLLHQCAHRGFARGRRRARRPQEQSAGPGLARLVRRQAPGRAGRSRQHLPRCRPEWGECGCSMCVGINGDIVPPGERCASTTNRNFRGRQGPGARTHLMSPAMVAAAAVTGHLADVRPLLADARQRVERCRNSSASSPGLPARLANVDTDQIIPARFLKLPRSSGLGTVLFHDLRFDAAGQRAAGLSAQPSGLARRAGS